MKIEKGYGIYYIVHAISVMDMDLLKQLYKQIAIHDFDKMEVSDYIRDFKRIIIEVLDFDDDYFEVVHCLCEKDGCPNYSYTFTANHTRINFTLQFEETFDGMVLIKDCCDETNENQIRFSSYRGKKVEAPF
jgi:hypothetical protein